MLAFGAYSLVSYRDSNNRSAYDRARESAVRAQQRVAAACEEVARAAKEPEADKLNDWFGEDCSALDQSSLDSPSTVSTQASTEYCFDISDDVDDVDEDQEEDADSSGKLIEIQMELVSDFENQVPDVIDLELVHLHVQTIGSTKILANRSDLKGRVAILNPQDWRGTSNAAVADSFDDDFGFSAKEPERWSPSLSTFLKLAVGEGLAGFAICSPARDGQDAPDYEEVGALVAFIKATLEELSTGPLPVWHLIANAAAALAAAEKGQRAVRVASSSAVAPAEGEVFALPGGREGLYVSDWLPEGQYLSTLEKKARSLVDLMSTAAEEAAATSGSKTWTSSVLGWFGSETDPAEPTKKELAETKEEMAARERNMSLYFQTRWSS